MAHLSTSNGIYSVDFRGHAPHFIFNSEPEELGNLIENYGKHGIISVKRYQPEKGSFKKLSLKEIEQFFSWDTHTIEQLKKKNFIK